MHWTKRCAGSADSLKQLTRIFIVSNVASRAVGEDAQRLKHATNTRGDERHTASDDNLLNMSKYVTAILAV